MHHNKTLLRFLLKSLGLYIVWTLLYFGYISTHTRLEEKMTSSIASISSNIMNVWGFHTSSIDSFDGNRFEFSEIRLDQAPLLLIADSCNGLTLLILFAGFIIAYPGNWKVKTIYIFIGSALIYLVNLIRIQILLFNIMYNESSFDFNHKYTYTIAVYLFVFVLWMLWANHFSNKRNLLMLNRFVSKTN